MKLTHGNILAVYFMANHTEVISGERWYSDAFQFCSGLASETGLSVSAVAGVAAALSPNNRWNRNMVDAAALCRTCAAGTFHDAVQIKVSTFHANKRKALQILAGDSPLSVLSGLKVRSFYGCIMGDPDAICIDGHAYAIWLGRYVPTTATPKISAKLYESISQDYRQATHTINQITGRQYTAAQIQSITWCVWQRIRREVGS